MATGRRPPLSAGDLWRLDRVGTPSLAPDGRAAVCAVTRGSLASNRSTSRLWRVPTQPGAAPRLLTTCGDGDGQPAWSPRGDRIAFLARRAHAGGVDETPQLYLISPDGGEAERRSAFAPGIESFKWMPDGRRIVFAAWVWPELRGAAAQARRHKAFGARKETGYLTGEAYYRHWDRNLPMGRVLHLLLLHLDTGRITDLFEGTGCELPRDAEGHEVYDPSPDGRRVAFVHDPDATQLQTHARALAEVEVGRRRLRSLARDPAWDFGAPRYRPDGGAIAVTAAHVGPRHNAFGQLALVEPGRGWRTLQPAGWDRDVQGPLRWTDDGGAVLFAAQDRGRCPLWRCDLGRGGIGVEFDGGWVQGFDLAGGTVVTASDTCLHPARLHARRLGSTAAPRRLDRFNDALLARRRLGRVQEVVLEGARGEPVQMWLTWPAGFDPGRRHPLLQVIHGGPYAAAGDSFSYRWNPHVLAGRGHVVAQVNYHGSSGFGFAFRDSIVGRQGELELQDIEAASDWLRRQPWADRGRLSAAGGSYGGFLVAWMNGHLKPGRYRSYVCHAGVFDRIATFSADSYLERPRDLGARYWEDMARVLAQSPHGAAARMATPTLISHGALDYRVPDCNGLAYYNTLKARGVEARLLWFPDENHWVLKPHNSVLWYRTVLDWVEAHDAAPAPRSRSPVSRRARA